MVFNGLWDELTIIEQQKMDVIRKDWTEGKVPDLPFVIIDQQGLKQHIGEKLQTIDGERMTTTVVKAQYGDGKTNVLKYLSLYFKLMRTWECIFSIAVQTLTKRIYLCSCCNTCRITALMLWLMV